MDSKYLKQFDVDISLIEKIGFNPYYVNLCSGLDDPLIIDGKEYINLAANNYLGLASDERLKKAIIAAVNKYGASMCGTPIATGCIDLYSTLEKRVASFVGVDNCILLPSCYQANNGIFSALASKKDTIIVDRFAHSSLIEGIKAVGCKIRPFKHNDMDSLEKNLKKSEGNVFVVTESVFSTEGSIAPFDEINMLCEKYGATAVIDDSHGIGVIGKQGRGILSHKNIKNFKGIYTTSLGKSIANAGGIIGGDFKLMNYLRYYCTHLIYSTAVTPATIAGTTEVLNILEGDSDHLFETMWEYKNRISSALNSFGYQLVEGEAPINSILCGSTEATLDLAKKVYQAGILSTPFVYPSVTKAGGVLRLIAGANLKSETVDRAIEIFKDIKE